MTAPGCIAPLTCPVPSPDDLDLRRVRTAWWPKGTVAWTTYSRAHYPGLFNASGLGSARFSPLIETGHGLPPVLYLARTMTASLLETAFHDVHDSAPRRISLPQDLEPRGTIQLRTPGRFTFVDLRDEALEHLGLSRDQLVATTPAHYSCTREWAERLIWRKVGRAEPVGLLWRSRVTELAQYDHELLDDLLTGDTAEIAMVVGQPHRSVSVTPGEWHDDGLRHHPTLHSGEGRAIIDHIATTYLDATVVDA